MKILAVLYLALFAVIAKDAISDIRKNNISVLDLLFPAIFILLGTIIVYTTISS